MSNYKSIALRSRVKRPKAESGEGKTPALGDHQARELLAAPGDETIKEKRDRTILSTLLYHALRGTVRAEGQGFYPRAPRRAASERLRQGREDPVFAAAPRDQRADPRLPRSRRPRRGRERSAVPARSGSTVPANSKRRSIPTWSTGWCAGIQRSSALKSAPTRCGRRLPPMPSIIRPTSPRSRNGSGTPTSPPPASTITARHARRTPDVQGDVLDDAVGFHHSSDVCWKVAGNENVPMRAEAPAKRPGPPCQPACSPYPMVLSGAQTGPRRGAAFAS